MARAKRLGGGPRLASRSNKTQWGGRGAPRRPGRSTKKPRYKGRCAVVAIEAKRRLVGARTGGIRAVLDMAVCKEHASTSEGRNIVLAAAEMLNRENDAYKLEPLKQAASIAPTGVLCHDTACRGKKKFTPHMTTENVFLDKWHKATHKCDKKTYAPPAWLKGNSEAAEQLFSKTNKFAPAVSNMRTPRYRCFLRHYFRWRNNFLRQGSLRGDVTRVKKTGHLALKLRHRL